MKTDLIRVDPRFKKELERICLEKKMTYSQASLEMLKIKREHDYFSTRKLIKF